MNRNHSKQDQRGLIRAALASLALLAATSSQAAIVTFIETNGNEITDYSMPKQISYDVKWHNNLPIVIDVTLEPGDTELLAFSGIHLNDSDMAFDHLRIDLPTGFVWHQVNQIRLPDGVALHSINQSPSTVMLNFDPALPDRGTVLLGSPDNPMADPLTDWLIRVVSFDEVNPNNSQNPNPPSFLITVVPDPPANTGQNDDDRATITIPEPASLTLMAIGLAAVRCRRMARTA